jgi:hypothetical protein
MPRFNIMSGALSDIDRGVPPRREAIPGNAMTRCSSNPGPAARKYRLRRRFVAQAVNSGIIRAANMPAPRSITSLAEGFCHPDNP